MDDKGKTPEDLRCQCGKIVAQKLKRKLYIKCRHCKRFLTINTQTDCNSWSIEYK